MLKFVIRRVLLMIPVLLGVLIIVFTLSCFMPGDPVLNYLGDEYTQEQYDAVEHDLGLDRSYIVRLADYIWGVASRFDLGTSYSTKQPVMNSISSRVWVTLRLGLLSTALVIVVGIPAGVFSALRSNSVMDYTITTISIFLASVPGFWLALQLIILFALHLKLLPASGLRSISAYILPVTCNALMSVASITRMTRSSMLEVIRQDYIRTARAKGMTEGRLVRKHAIKNALIPVVTMLGSQMSMLIGGSVIIESIFSIPGMGTLLITGINQRDYPMILGITVIICIFVSIMNLLVDLVYSAIDPRVKAQFSEGKLFRKKEKASAEGGKA
jgi:peptide/nickel transport system permease protein